MSEMDIGQFGNLTSAGCTLQKSFLYKIRLVDFLYRTGIFAKSSRDSAKSDGPALEFRYYRRQNLIVDFVETISVDI